jgi:uncharacterized membrane-anchored protein YitT (DUF2179 family)
MVDQKNALEQIRWRDLIIFVIGTALYGWGLVNVNIPNHLAEGGVSGITLILRALFGVNPALSTLLLNVPLLLLGYRELGRKALIYTIIGIGALSFWLWFWQRFPMAPNLQHDLLISALLAGIFGGLGSGMIYRFGGTTGGSDVIARIMEQKWQIPMGRSLFVLDALVLLTSLVYINVVQMMYTLIASFVFAQLVNFTQQGAYSARAFMIFSTHAEEISHAIMDRLERGTSLLHSEGGYTHREQRVVYVVVDPSELNEVRNIIKEFDDHAFVSIFNVQETLGEGFSFARPKKRFFRLH